MPDPIRTKTLGEILPAAALRELQTFLGDAIAGRLPKPGSDHPSLRLQLKARVLEPFADDLTKDWDLDYLSYAICYQLDQTRTGLHLSGG